MRLNAFALFLPCLPAQRTEKHPITFSFPQKKRKLTRGKSVAATTTTKETIPNRSKNWMLLFWRIERKWVCEQARDMSYSNDLNSIEDYSLFYFFFFSLFFIYSSLCPSRWDNVSEQTNERTSAWEMSRKIKKIRKIEWRTYRIELCVYVVWLTLPISFSFSISLYFYRSILVVCIADDVSVITRET